MSAPEPGATARALDGVVIALLPLLSPSGALAQVAARNTELDVLLERFDADEAALAHAQDRTLVARLEDDFALCVPAIADAALPLEAWAIPLLASLAAPPLSLLISFGLQVALKLALVVLKSWAAKRATSIPVPPPRG